jgi:hypothetical protein
MARAYHWTREILPPLGPDTSYTQQIITQPIGWTLIRTRWNIEFTSMVGSAFAYYPEPTLTYGIIATQGNPSPAPFSPSINPDQDFLWWEQVFFTRFDTSVTVPNFAINKGPVGDHARDSKAQRLNTNVEIGLYIIADYATTGGHTFAVRGGVEALWLDAG